ncbi:MAG: NAD(P)/FAD-dependent oxidoreductase [Acidobacteria bacterium]|nr:NAD(P)/FAD-dependent oxidoreductase [Acidobacteriota bacterium]
MKTNSQNIAIVGSGFLGMTVALRLADAGHRVTIFEAAGEIGGLASAWTIGNYTWDRHYHVTLLSDEHTRGLINELGLEDQFRWVETKTGFYSDGELHSMSNSLEFLKFPPLDLISKLRLGYTIFKASRITDWRELEKITVEEWLTRLSGRKTFEKIWRPLLLAKLGESYKHTSAAFIWATIQRMYAARRSGLKKEMFGYVRGGYANVLKRFAEVLNEKGVEVRLNSPVQSVEKLANGTFNVRVIDARRKTDLAEKYRTHRTKYAAFNSAVSVAAGFSGAFLTEPEPTPRRRRSDRVAPPPPEEFDRVILTCPSSKAAEITPQLEGREHLDLANIRYQGIICASVLLRSSLSKFYVTNITDNSPFTGIIEMTALVNKTEFGGNSLVYLPKYVDPDDRLFDASDDSIRETFLAGLEKMYPRFKRRDVLAFRVSKVKRVFPLPVLNYSEDLPPMRTSVDGLYIVNSTHIVNGTLNVNETVALAKRFAGELLDELAAGGAR